MLSGIDLYRRIGVPISSATFVTWEQILAHSATISRSFSGITLLQAVQAGGEMPLGHRCPGKPCYDVITVIETRLRNGSFFSAEAPFIVFVTLAEQLSHKNKQGFLMKDLYQWRLILTPL